LREAVDYLRYYALRARTDFAMRFAGITGESTLREYADEQVRIRETLDLRALATEVAERQDRLGQVADQVKRLQGSLRELLRG